MHQLVQWSSMCVCSDLGPTFNPQSVMCNSVNVPKDRAPWKKRWSTKKTPCYLSQKSQQKIICSSKAESYSIFLKEVSCPISSGSGLKVPEAATMPKLSISVSGWCLDWRPRNLLYSVLSSIIEEKWNINLVKLISKTN